MKLDSVIRSQSHMPRSLVSLGLISLALIGYPASLDARGGGGTSA